MKTLLTTCLVILMTGCQQFPQLPAGVVGVNLTYTVAPVVKPIPADTPEPSQPE